MEKELLCLNVAMPQTRTYLDTPEHWILEYSSLKNKVLWFLPTCTSLVPGSSDFPKSYQPVHYTKKPQTWSVPSPSLWKGGKRERLSGNKSITVRSMKKTKRRKGQIVKNTKPGNWRGATLSVLPGSSVQRFSWHLTEST